MSEPQKRTVLTVPCGLTEDEFKTKSSELARKINELRRTEEAKKDAAAEWKLKIDLLKAEVLTLTDVVSTKTELRPVDCEEVPMAGPGTVEVVRCDTGEVVRVRSMTEDEKYNSRQVSLAFTAGDDDEPEPKKKSTN
jgi:hypothetical protein